MASSMQHVFAELLIGATAAVALLSVAVVIYEFTVATSSFEHSTLCFYQLTWLLKMTLTLSRGMSSLWYKMCEQLVWSCTRAQEVQESKRRPKVWKAREADGKRRPEVWKVRKADGERRPEVWKVRKADGERRPGVWKAREADTERKARRSYGEKGKRREQWWTVRTRYACGGKGIDPCDTTGKPTLKFIVPEDRNATAGKTVRVR